MVKKNKKLFLSVDFEEDFSLSKSAHTKMKIIEEAIQLYSEKGFKGATFELIAQKSKVSRPLIIRYFKSREHLFLTSIDYVRKHFVQFVLSKVKGKKASDQILKAYVQAHFEWVDEYSSFAKCWLIHFHACSVNKLSRSQNTHVVNVGWKRISQLIKVGVQEKKFKVKSSDEIARIIQVLLTGALVSYTTEDAVSTKLLPKVTWAGVKKLVE